MFSGAVLTGGAGTRMGPGVDKALLEVAGRPMAAIAAEALRGAGAIEVLAIGGSASGGSVPVADLHPGAGPLGGIITALRHASHDVVVVLACDLPLVDAATVARVADALGVDDDAAVPVHDGRLEPLCAAYRRSCLAPFERAFAAGERAPRRALAAVVVATVTVTEPHRLRSANSPDDLRAMTSRDAQSGGAG